MAGGAQCVMMASMQLLLRLSAKCWDMSKRIVLVFFSLFWGFWCYRNDFTSH